MGVRYAKVDFDANEDLATVFHVDENTLPSMRIGAAELHEIVPEGSPDGAKPVTAVRLVRNNLILLID